MLDPLVITLVAAVLAWDALFAGRSGAPAAPQGLAFGAIAPLAIALVAHLRMGMVVRALDRDGRTRRLMQGDRTLLAAKAAIGACFVGAALGYGWIDVVRGAIGDLVIVDEALAIAPALVAVLWLWAAHYPVERRVREALILRTLDTDAGLYAIPTRAQHVLDLVRHRVLLALVPIAIIAAWVEGLDRALAVSADRGWINTESGALQIGAGVMEATGALVTLALTPPIIRRIWNTVPLGEGALRERLMELCRRQRVRIAEMLVWRTHGTTLNAAVMGVFGPMRYVLLSDALLERLPDDELEAVVAHEVGHARRRHLPWLMAAVGATIGLGGLLGDTIATTLLPTSGEAWAPWFDGGAIALGLIAGMWALGAVSRRFERQADAFAVQHLSGMRGGRTPSLEATPDATRAMAGALGRVAAISHIPAERFTWRHGSIASRQRAILAMTGRRLDACAADRAAGRAKVATLCAVVVLIALGSWRLATDARDAGRPEASDRPARWVMLSR